MTGIACEHGYPPGTECPYCKAIAASRAGVNDRLLRLVEALEHAVN